MVTLVIFTCKVLARMLKKYLGLCTISTRNQNILRKLEIW